MGFYGGSIYRRAVRQVNIGRLGCVIGGWYITERPVVASRLSVRSAAPATVPIRRQKARGDMRGASCKSPPRPPGRPFPAVPIYLPAMSHRAPPIPIDAAFAGPQPDTDQTATRVSGRTSDRMGAAVVGGRGVGGAQAGFPDFTANCAKLRRILGPRRPMKPTTPNSTGRRGIVLRDIVPIHFPAPTRSRTMRNYARHIDISLSISAMGSADALTMRPRQLRMRAFRFRRRYYERNLCEIQRSAKIRPLPGDLLFLF